MDGSQLSKTQLIVWQFICISIGRMPFLASTLDNADPLFALVITTPQVSLLMRTQVIYVHHVEVADQDLASGSLYYANLPIL